jgi:demethylmenaquinone methyltransferase/2-methoxy-6-polyprenyl-1,4-benzoquinol methylase
MLRAGETVNHTDAHLRDRAERIFAKVAPRYDIGNSLLSGGQHQAHRRRLVRWAAPATDARVLDLACGTGDLTWLLAERVRAGQVIGADLSAPMLALAAGKAPPVPGPVSFIQCDAGALPFPDQHFDLVTCGFAGRWFGDWDAVLSEVIRVLRPGGSFWNVDFGRPSSRVVDLGYQATLAGVGAVVGTVLMRDPRPYVTLAQTVRDYPGQRWLRGRMTDVGFISCTYERQLGMLAYNHGRKPGRRDGLSTGR